MSDNVRNFLYRNPSFYEQVYAKPDAAPAKMCVRIFSKYLATMPSSILDIGCGTGSDLGFLVRSYPDCWGIDYYQDMVAFARKHYPLVHFEVGDMRSIRLERTFDVILCLGSAFSYALTNDDIEKVLHTFSAHAHPGTLVILDIWNAMSFVGNKVFEVIPPIQLNTANFSATGTSVYSFDRKRQLLVRHRLWKISGQPDVEDFCQYRLLFPAELTHFFTEQNFHVVGIFDNDRLQDSDFSQSRLYLVAMKI